MTLYFGVLAKYFFAQNGILLIYVRMKITGK